MATIFLEGFDKYAPVALSTSTTLSLDSLLVAEWSSVNTASGFFTVSLVTGLSSTGFALSCNGGGNINGGSAGVTKTFSTSYSRLVGGVRVQPQNSLLGTPMRLNLNKAGTNQCTITINGTGAISLRTGGSGGTAIATSSTTVASGVTHYLEWDITIGASGAYQVWLDGVSIFSGTGNTRGDGVNNNTDGLSIGVDRPGVCVLDDLYVFDTTGTVNNAVLLTSPRIETSFPTSDSQRQFTEGATALGQLYTTGSTNAPGANELFLRPFTPGDNTTLNSISAFMGASSTTAKFKAVLYSDSAGAPQTLSATGSEVVGCSSSATLTSSFASPPALAAGTQYWLGFITDTSVVIFLVDSTTPGQKVANTYTSGAPSTAPGMTTNQSSWVLWGNCSGSSANWTAENGYSARVADVSYIYSQTVGNEDLYGFGALSFTPITVHTIGVKALARKTDTGNRTLNVQLKSGSTDATGSLAVFTPAPSYQWADSYFDTDPNTNSGWTGAAAVAATAGIKIAS